MLKLKNDFSEFITIYDEKGNKSIVFQSDEIDRLEDSICTLLDHLNIEYELI